jgi:excisionase family DNA binding protein
MSLAPAPLPTLLTVDETAALLRTSPRAVYKLIERAQVPGVTRLGRRVLFDRAMLVEWLSESRAASSERTRR